MSAPADRLLSPAFSCKPQRKRIASRAYTTVAPATALLALLAVILVLQPVQMLVWAFLPPVRILSSSSSISRSPPPSPLFLPSSRLSTLHLGPLYGGRDDEKAFRKVQQSKRQLRVGRLLQSTVADVIRKVYIEERARGEEGGRGKMGGSKSSDCLLRRLLYCSRRNCQIRQR